MQSYVSYHLDLALSNHKIDDDHSIKLKFYLLIPVLSL
jgi:hypothetical protein